MNYLQFEFTTESTTQMDQLVALLSNEGFEGFEEEDNNLNAFIPESVFNETEFIAIIGLFNHIIYTKTIVENINWNKQWEEGFKPVLVDDFVAVRADFHLPITNVEHDLIITPKMSFGTGHHATTYLVIKQMQDIIFVEKEVLDFGTGTGVLAILAEKLGASKIIAIDYDEWSITNTLENIEQNSCTKISVQQADKLDDASTYDVILANINLNVILANLPAIKKSAASGATILLSGFLKENELEMQQALNNIGLNYVSTIQLGEWIVLIIKN